MFELFGEHYYFNLANIDKFVNGTVTVSGETEERINVVKYEMVKFLMDTILTEHDEIDEKLGMKSATNTSIPFRLAFNSLLNKKLINHY